MKTRELKMEDGKWRVADSECGNGSPLFPDATCRVVPKHGHVRALPKLLLCFTLLLLAFSLRAWGQSYSIDWYKIAGGGGTSTNGQYAVTGTIGQHDAGGAMTGGNYSLTGGFWALISVSQTPGAPTLYIGQSGGTVTVYWQNVSGWGLQTNNNLSLPANWSASGGVTTSNGTNYLNITPPAGNLFFRLQHP